MEITFNENTFELTTKIIVGIEMYSLKDIENGWNASKPTGSSSKRLDNWMASKDTKELISLTEIQVVVSREGSSSVTYGDEHTVVEYASHCSIPFRAAVRRTFLAAAKGQGAEAVKIASQAINVHKVMLSKRPANQIRKFLADHYDIHAGVASWITKSANNKKAAYEDRVRTLKSLRYVVDESYDKLSARQHSKVSEHEAALKIIAIEERRISRVSSDHTH